MGSGPLALEPLSSVNGFWDSPPLLPGDQEALAVRRDRVRVPAALCRRHLEQLLAAADPQSPIAWDHLDRDEAARRLLANDTSMRTPFDATSSSTRC